MLFFVLLLVVKLVPGVRTVVDRTYDFGECRVAEQDAVFDAVFRGFLPPPFLFLSLGATGRLLGKTLFLLLFSTEFLLSAKLLLPFLFLRLIDLGLGSGHLRRQRFQLFKGGVQLIRAARRLGLVIEIPCLCQGLFCLHKPGVVAAGVVGGIFR